MIFQQLIVLYEVMGVVAVLGSFGIKEDISDTRSTCLYRYARVSAETRDTSTYADKS